MHSNTTRPSCSHGSLFSKQLCQSKHDQGLPLVAFQEDLRPLSLPCPYSDFLLGEFELSESVGEPHLFFCSDLQLPLHDPAARQLRDLKSKGGGLAVRF